MAADARQQILDLLHENARYTTAQIATMLGLAEAEVIDKIAALEGAGIIRKYTAMIDREKAGDTSVEAWIEVRVQPQRGVGFDGIAERIYRYPEVRSCYLMSGTFDLAVLVTGRDLKEVARFVAEKLAVIDGVAGTTTHFVLKRYKLEGVFMTEQNGDERLAVTP